MTTLKARYELAVFTDAEGLYLLFFTNAEDSEETRHKCAVGRPNFSVVVQSGFLVAISPGLLDTSSVASLVPALLTALAVAAAPGTAAVVAAKLEPLWSVQPGRWFSACAAAHRALSHARSGLVAHMNQTCHANSSSNMPAFEQIDAIR